MDLPLDPMHGTVGVAPANLEVRSALTPDAHGGNMDTPEMRAGTTCFLGVNVAGALFSLGDGHARQGEGETCGVAVECAMDTVVIVDLIKDRVTPWPRIESDSHIMSTGSARPLEDAFRIAQTDLVQWIAEDHNLSVMDAYQLVTQAVVTACQRLRHQLHIRRENPQGLATPPGTDRCPRYTSSYAKPLRLTSLATEDGAHSRRDNVRSRHRLDRAGHVRAESYPPDRLAAAQHTHLAQVGCPGGVHTDSVQRR